MPKIQGGSKIINLGKAFCAVFILILLAGNVFFWLKYSTIQQELEKTKEALIFQETDEKILDFTKLFIEKVLKAEDEINFETRLQLENAVRSLSDSEVLAQWQKFVESETEIEAQEAVKNLLEVLVSKIKE